LGEGVRGKDATVIESTILIGSPLNFFGVNFAQWLLEGKER
jgi:hypothetical protein